ncbi:subtilisin-like protein [Lentinus brumalis]|uniref:Subtilisin-like protein n=1 Tax=Lentinus brumalis TaxID=2498619 RepID=A0A371DXH7_9APHY|nr:subtilisin-like protein [Polyporus brumalis]
MAFSRLLFCLASFIACAVAAPRAVPEGWSLHRRADPDAVLPLKFTLAQSNLHNLDAYLLDVADPRSPNYGKHWTPAKVAETFRPSKETVDTVHSWLVEEAGIDTHKIRLSQKGDVVHLDLTVAEAESLLGAEYFVYRHGEDGKEHVGCHQGYTLPERVSKHIDFVWPTTHLGSTSLLRRDAGVSTVPGFGRVSGAPKIPVGDVSALAAEGCDTAATIDCLRGLYKYDHTLVSGDKNSVAVAEFSNEVYRPSDLDLFFKTYAPDQVGHIPETISIAGGDPTVSGDLGESTLDIELVMGLLGAGQNLSLYQIGQAASSSVFLDPLLGAVDGSYCELEGVSNQGLSDCGNKPTVNVVSISYHFNPDVIDPTISPIVQRECTEIGKLSLTGMTFIASSGDGGVGYSQSGFCQLANGTLQAGNPKGAFLGQLPASCPYVTAVGATSVAPNNTVDDPEIATTRFPSGGGFSNNFPRPTWQDDAVTNYLDNFGPNYAENIFNRSGRAYPDVAANGWPLVIAESGQFVKSGGTSASAPIFAAIVTAVNDARIAAGKSPVGWINPALYSSGFANAYNDVTKGTNPGCSTQGFNAAPGWDPVTGLGTPNFPELLAAFLALP